MRSFYTAIDGQSLFFRTAGDGPPIFLFHASPSSSAMLTPLIEALAKDFLVIAPDTPGYGQSAPLYAAAINMRTYANCLHHLVQQLGFDQIAIYGTATGAQLGIRYALDHPDQVTHLFLDNAAHFTEQQRSAILKAYFPDITPRSDGGHLLTVWTMVRDLFTFFPWCFDQPEYRLSSPIPPAPVLHRVALDYLMAGSNYHLAYKAAFEHEKAAFVQDLQIPTTLFHWTSSIVQPYIQQLIQQGLPTNVVVKEIETTNRMASMAAHIKEKNGGRGHAELDLSHCELAPPVVPRQMDLPRLEPDEYGGYLLKAWFHLRDQQARAENVLREQKLIQAEELQRQLIRWLQMES